MASATDRHCPNCGFLLPKATRPRAKQQGSVETPPDLFAALSSRFDYSWDLAAEDHNSKCEFYFSKEEDSLKQDWVNVCPSAMGWGWLNPEFGFMKPWAAKCAEEMQRGAQVTMLAQASVGSRWYRDHVQGFAQVWNLHPRVQFVGHPIVFPKDLILCVYKYGIDPCVRSFNWKDGVFTYG